MKTLRILCQLLFLALFLILLVWSVSPLSTPVRPEFFLRADPLIAVSTALAGRSLNVVKRFLPWAAVMLVAAFVLGRGFCGWICPLGTTFDISDKIFTGFARKKNKPAPGLAKCKFLLLGVLLVFAAMALEITGWFDPLCIATRTFTTSIHPALDYAGKKALIRVHKLAPLKEPAAGLYSSLVRHKVLIQPTYKVKPEDGAFQDSRNEYSSDLDELSNSAGKRTAFAIYRWGIIYGALLAGLLMLQLIAKRFWCRAVCPLGALLGIVGARRVLGLVVTDACTDCGKCVQACGLGAIVKGADGKRVVLNTECTLCMNCFKACPTKAIVWGAFPNARLHINPVPGRRALLAGGIAALVTRPLFALSFRKAAQSRTLIRPPGAGTSKVEEEEFLDRCIRCGECMKACPKVAIHPAGLESGLEGLWTPVIIPARGYCRYECVPNDVETEAGNYCGVVCPTGAIKILTRKEKKSTVIGTAFIQKNRCLPYAFGGNCTLCHDICPVGAIRLVPSGPHPGVKRPFVDVHKCLGCGACEYICPVAGPRGIRVGRKQAVADIAPFESPRPRERRPRGS